MRRTLTIACLSASVMILSHCSPKIPSTMLTTATTSAEKVAEVKRNYTDVQMEEGRIVWQGSCGKCHKLFTPESRNVEKWEKILPRMVKRSKLDDTAAGKVRAYLLAHTQPE